MLQFFNKGNAMSCTVIGESNFKRYFRKSISKQYVKDTHIACFDNAIIVNEHEHGFGVFDKDFNLIKDSLQTRRNKSQFIPKFNHDNIPYVDEDVAFIGNVNAFFGHFLLEHMNRIYALMDKKYKDRKVVLINDKSLQTIPGYIFQFIELFGVKRENVIILDENTRFRSVCVPSQSFNARLYTSNSFAQTFDRIANNIPDEEIYDKIYVSRAKLDKLHKTLGEEKVQNVFEKNGFKIIYPEKLPLKSQIALVKNCRVLAGCAGTALHLALFMKPGGTVISIKRNRRPACNAMIQNNVNNTKHLDGIFISGSIETAKTFHSTNAPQIIAVNQYMQEFFDEYGYKYTDKDLGVDSDAWQEYKVALDEYNETHGQAFIRKIKRFFIKYSSLFVLGRERRGRYRKWLKNKLNFKK